MHSRGLSFDWVFLTSLRKGEGAPGVPGGARRHDRYGLLAPGGRAVVQHYVHNVMDETAGSLYLLDHRVYGTNALAFYGRAEHPAPDAPGD